MSQENYLENLRTCLKAAETVTHPFSTVNVQHLADGVIAVEDSTGEFDCYFDPEQWEASFPAIWGDDGLFPPAVKRAQLGVLPGLGIAPAVRDFQGAAKFAAHQLKPKGSATWHNPLPPVQPTL